MMVRRLRLPVGLPIASTVLEPWLLASYSRVSSLWVTGVVGSMIKSQAGAD